MSKLQKFIQPILTKQAIGLYIHIPFCTTLCPFCDFYKKSWSVDLESKFITAIQKEIQTYKQEKKIQLKSIFLGGGTPSVLSKSSIMTLMSAIISSFDTSTCKEITFEANPEDITASKLKHFKTAGFNRISLGVQTLNDNECSQLGRGHNAKQSHEAIQQIKKDPYWNLSVDIMFGIQQSTLRTLENTLTNILSYNPNHISTYCLTIEENTAFHKQGIKPIHPEKELEQYKLIQSTLKKHNYAQYEVSSFAKTGFECEHNKHYWNFGNFIGLGPSGHSFVTPYRYTNEAHLLNYCKDPTPAIFKNKIDALTKDELIKEHILANFRRLKGLDIKNINHLYEINFEESYKTQLKKLYKLNYINKINNYIKATPKGLYMLNSLVSEFL